MYWRLPGNDELFKQYYSENLKFKDFWVRNEKTGQIVDNERTRALKNSDSFLRSSKSRVAEYLFILNDKQDIDNPRDWRFSYAPGGFHILGDCPIVLLDENQLDILNAQFIVPLSKDHYLTKIAKQISIDRMPPEFGLLLYVLNLEIQGIILHV